MALKTQFTLFINKQVKIDHVQWIVKHECS